MDNKLFGMAFAAVFSMGIFVYGATNAGAYAVDNWLFPTEEFGDNTYIGTTDVSNMAVESAKTKFVGQTEAWRENAELIVTYQDAVEIYSLKDAEILLDETLINAETGAQNSFVFQLPASTTRSFLGEYFSEADFSEADINAIHRKLETSLQGGQTKTQVSISDDSLSLDREIVAEAVFSSTLSSGDSSIIIEELDGIQLASNSQFSFLDLIAELPLIDVSDTELTQIASVIYSALLQTNFLIDERSIGSQVPTFIPLGQEAAINRHLGIDLIFTNPNDSTFTLNLSKGIESLTASITGYPFQYDYAVGITEETNIEPRLVKHYSAFVNSGNQVQSEGLSGKRLDVIRTIFDGNEEKAVETISNDFYPPVHRVEVHPLKQQAADSIVPIAGEPGFIDANEDGIHDEAPVDSFPTIGQPGYIDMNGDGIHDGVITVPTIGQPGFVDENEDGIHDVTPTIITPTGPSTGQPGVSDDNRNGGSDIPITTDPAKDEETAPEVPVYDKGGKLISK